MYKNQTNFRGYMYKNQAKSFNPDLIIVNFKLMLNLINQFQIVHTILYHLNI